jgi:hypothetical protein
MSWPPSVLHKLFYSKLHLNVLDATIARYLDNPLDAVSCEQDDAGNPLITVGRGSEVPSIIPLRAGDVLQNLRSILDYLVTELVVANKGTPTDKNAFPVCDSSRTTFDAAAKSRLKGVSPSAIVLIESLQPYHFGEIDKNNSIIFILDELANINKHRNILLARKRAVPLDQMAVIDASGETIRFDVRLAPDDQTVSRLLTEAIQMQMNKKVSVFVAFDERPVKGLEVSALLTSLINQMETEILPLFGEFFA